MIKNASLNLHVILLLCVCARACVYETPGAKFVYENFVDEVFQKHEVDIDHSLAVCKAQVALYSFENSLASYSHLRIS